MTQAFEDYAASRLQYAATMPRGEFDEALDADKLMAVLLRAKRMREASEVWNMRNTALHKLTVRALRNQGEPYSRKIGD